MVQVTAARINTNTGTLILIFIFSSLSKFHKGRPVMGNFASRWLFWLHP
jgi:hypothetical protein